MKPATDQKPVLLVALGGNALVKKGFIVICCGGGGIPVVRAGRTFDDVDAVIDKDLVSARLAEEVGVDLFIIATDVDGVALNFGKPDECFLNTVSLEEVARHILDGHFSAGAMLPKVEAAMQFVDGGGKRAVITRVDRIADAVEGKAGTEFISEN